MDDALPLSALAKPSKQLKGSDPLPLSKLPKPAAAPTGPSALGQFVRQSEKSVLEALKEAGKQPTLAVPATLTAFGKGLGSVAEIAVAGITALSKTLWMPAQGGFADDYTANYNKIHDAISLVEKVPETQQEQAMNQVLAIIPNGVNAAGDTVYEKTGSALLATGTVAAGTLLAMSPGIAGKALKGVGKVLASKTPTSASAGFDALAARSPDTAWALANHVGQIDPELAGNMKEKVAKYKNATPEEMDKLASAHAEALLPEMTPIDETIRGLHSEFYGEKEGEFGVGVGENMESRHAPRKSKGKSGYSDLATETRTGLGVGEGKASKHTPTKSGRSGYGESANDRGEPVVEPEFGLSTGEGKASPHKPAAGGGSSGYLDLVTSKPPPNPEQLAAAIRTSAKNGTEALAGTPKSKPKAQPANGLDKEPVTKAKKPGIKGPDKQRGSISFNRDPKFKAWFGKSKVTEKDGTPKRVYHGTAAAFDRFDLAKSGTVTQAESAKNAIWFTSSPDVASQYADNAAKELGQHTLDEEEFPPGSGNIIKSNFTYGDNLRPVYLRMEKPLVISSRRWSAKEEQLGREDVPGKRSVFMHFVDLAKKGGYDGLLIRDLVDSPNNDPFWDQADHYAVFSPEQIHSAVSGEKVFGTQPDIVYFNNGIPVTREMVAKAFHFTTDLMKEIPGVSQAAAGMGRLYQGYIETFNPEAEGPAARTAGAAIARNFFEQAHDQHKIIQDGKLRREYWLKMGKDAGMEFIHQFEKGKRFANLEWEAKRLEYKKWAERIYRQDKQTGFKYDRVDHYMPHLFEDGNAVTAWLQKRYGNKWADPGFIKERGFDLYEEAMKEGFTPKFTNPEDIMQARQLASDIAALRKDLFVELEKLGVAKKALKGETRSPEGFHSQTWRSPVGDRYWVHEDTIPLIKNALDSKSLWEDQRLRGGLFRGYMEIKNRLIPVKLMASLFHPMHVLHIDAAADLTRNTKSYLANPTMANFGKMLIDNLVSAPYISPGSWYKSVYANTKAGLPILRVFQGKLPFDQLSAADKAAFADLAEGGLVPTRPMEETAGIVQKWKDAYVQKSLRAIVHLPWAMLASLSHPIYGTWIPSLKIASYLKDAKVAREANPDWTDAQRQVAFRDIAKKVEARYGEMNYQSMFMNKIAKDIGTATTLSLGWNIGLLDQYVGGAIDLGRAAVEPGSLKSKVVSGRLDRPIMAAYYLSTAMMLGGLMHKWFTGEDPKELIDYTHPKSGEKDQYGKDIRLNTMWYTREFEGLHKHIEQQGVYEGVSDFVLNKGSGLGEMAKATITGVNSLGQEIRDPNAPPYKQFEQTLASELAELDPITIEALQKSTGSPAKNAVLSGLGFTPAGKYISNTVIEGKISNDYNKFVRPKEKPFQAVQMAKDMTKLREMYKVDDPKYTDKLDEVIKTYDLSPKDVRTIEHRFGSPKEQEFNPSIFMFSKLPWESQKPLLDQMSEDEREEYLKHVSKEKRQKYLRETE